LMWFGRNLITPGHSRSWAAAGVAVRHPLFLMRNRVPARLDKHILTLRPTAVGNRAPPRGVDQRSCQWKILMRKRPRARGRPPEFPSFFFSLDGPAVPVSPSLSCRGGCPGLFSSALEGPAPAPPGPASVPWPERCIEASDMLEALQGGQLLPCHRMPVFTPGVFVDLGPP